MASQKLELLSGTLDLIVLKLLRGGPANGWDLTQSILVVSKGTLDVNYGSLYPALRRLEDRGWVDSKWSLSDTGRRVRVYSLTRQGRGHLREEATSWMEFSRGITLVLRSEPSVV